MRPQSYMIIYNIKDGEKVKINGINKILNFERKRMFEFRKFEIFKRLNRGKKPISIINVYLIRCCGSIISV